MNILVLIVTSMLSAALVTQPSHAGTQTVEDQRWEFWYGYPTRRIVNGNNVGVCQDADCQTLWLNGMTDVPSHIGYRTQLIFNRWGLPQPDAPYCTSISGKSQYTDSSGTYGFRCNVLVRYVDTTYFQNYDPSKKTTAIKEFAVDTIWTKNGVEIDANTTLIPKDLATGFKLYLNSNGSRVYSENPFDVKYKSNVTKLALNIDDVVYSTGDYAIINYNWVATPAYPFISATGVKMYMEQIDSDITLSYVKPDGTGAAVIEPNTKINLEDISNGLTSNGQIKLKLDSKNAFGTLSSRLRVTVEWQ